MAVWLQKLLGIGKYGKSKKRGTPGASEGEKLTIICKTCGNIIDVDGSKSIVICPYCDANYTFINTLKNLHGEPFINRALNGLYSILRPTDDYILSEETVWLSGSPVNNKQLIHCARLDRLRDLNLAYTKISDEGLRHLTGLSNLQILDLKETDITDAGLEYIASLPKLRELHLANTAITDDGLARINPIGTLEKIGLGKTFITEKGLHELCAWPAVKKVVIDYSDFDMVSVLKGDASRFFKENAFLDLSMQGIQGEELALIRDFKEIETLALENNKITGSGLVHLKGLDKLKTLYLYDNPLEDHGLEHLHGLKSLKELSVFGTKVTESGINRLRSALPGCRVECRQKP